MEDTVYNDPRVKWCTSNLYDYFNYPISYEIDKDNRLIIHCNTLIINSDIGELPIKIDEVDGHVAIDTSIERKEGYFTSLKNMPDIVRGYFDISGNKGITSLEGGPKEVYGTYNITKCNVSSLEHLATIIEGSLLASSNNISKLDESKIDIVRGMINLSNNNIDINSIPNKYLYNMYGKYEF